MFAARVGSTRSYRGIGGEITRFELVEVFSLYFEPVPNIASSLAANQTGDLLFNREKEGFFDSALFGSTDPFFRKFFIVGFGFGGNDLRVGLGTRLRYVGRVRTAG